MNKQLYEVVPMGQPLEKNDLSIIPGAGNRLASAGEVMVVGYESNGLWIRPVSIERVTGTESAFPAFDGSGAVGGMTLREHYAGLAMQGLIASPTPWTADCEASTPMTSWKDVAEGSVQMADALIAALNKKEEGV